ncbi:ATP-binding cassette domain-containing protein [Desulfomicrobium sp. ZS1]|uniref:ATP-binding cassette domain-containing protein n=1 Tax=Desulfomicrobium sp. ZS1 TaxID=2952228 RepID=UPI0020B2EEDF|nr:ATP-binding cassette domain-containing protein [Desulfomicrobium sp. ZS1]UTF50783.1 ATP-binding cassette domain-containing protein [Desulfomicrobium sp. ZS1]
MAAVTLSGVLKTFPGLDKPALAGICGSIEAGVITGIAGPDGAGKTTLMRLMAGLLRPDSGDVTVLGLEPVAAPELRLKVGYMPQKFGLYEDLSVIENLTLHANLRGVTGEERAQTFERLLAFTDLKEFTTRLAGRLSGGMKQKLGLACALLGTPEVLLLDEPGVGVDPISRRELWKMVHELAEEGIAVVWSTAYLDEAEACDEVFLLSQGSLLFTGKPGDLTGRMQGRCLHLGGVEGRRRQALAMLLRQPEVSDGVIQGRNLRIVLKDGAARPDPTALEIPGQPEWKEVAPRFEDAFIDLLGGGPGGESALAATMQPRAEIRESLIRAEALTKNFGSFTATDHVSFEVRQGEIFGLLGPNGAGKSTTFKMMCGLLTPTSGRAEVMGIDLRHSPARARERLGYMAQKFSLYGKLTVRQNLDFFSGVYGLPKPRQRQAVESMIESFHLKQFLGVATDDLALGYKQRIALACAAMHEPDILFLDEPTSGVDPITRREFWNHINGVVEKGVTVMVTTHFMDEAEYCDRIGLVYHGKLIALAPPDDLKASVASPALPDPTMDDAFVELIHRQEQA